MTPLDILLWVAFPYAAAAVFIGGHIWRYRYDKFGWTTRSSQVYENRLLRIASPAFHLGILFVLVGHVVGLLIPAEWLYAIGISEEIYHVGATVLGTAAAVLTIVGLTILVYRRRTNPSVFLATTRMDKTMYVFLGATIAFGTVATVLYQVFGAGYEYRGTVGPWTRSLILFQPQPELMTEVPLAFQLHVLTATALFALWPFTRLVHVFSAPVGYLFRPYIVYRSRDGGRAAQPARRGWEPMAPPEQRSRSRVGRG